MPFGKTRIAAASHTGSSCSSVHPSQTFIFFVLSQLPVGIVCHQIRVLLDRLVAATRHDKALADAIRICATTHPSTHPSISPLRELRSADRSAAQSHESAPAIPFQGTEEEEEED